MKRSIVFVLFASFAVSACDTGAAGVSKSRGPDEFSVVPTKPLEEPESFDVLPEPTPGQGNLVDKRPGEDAVAALGGNPNLLNNGQLRSGEQTLLATTSRYGVDPEIRAKTQEEDAELRKKNRPRILERLANTGYLRPYKDSLLDSDAEATRLSRRGVKVTAPPEATEE